MKIFRFAPYFHGLTSPNEILQQVVAEFGEDTKVHQVGGEMTFPSLFAYVPWGHHVEIITKCKTLEEAFFYIQKTIEEGLGKGAANADANTAPESVRRPTG